MHATYCVTYGFILISPLTLLIVVAAPWRCNGSDVEYLNSHAVTEHPRATFGHSYAVIGQATSECMDTGSLINATELDKNCLTAFRDNLTAFYGISTPDLWLAKNGSQCLKFTGGGNAIETVPCDEKLRFLCQRPSYTGKYT